MTAPTSPTLASLVTEALKKAGWTNPSTNTKAPYTRARDEWMEEIKNDINVLLNGRYLESLQTERVLALTDGRSRYSQPTDYMANQSMVILDGSHQNTAQAGATGSITLASSEDVTDIEGKEIVITSGTGVNQISQIYSYDSTTKIASVTPSWAVTPNITSVYMIADNYYPLVPKGIEDYDSMVIPTTMSRPTFFFPIGDNDDGEFILNPVPNRNETGKAYILKQRYYVDLMEVDLISTLMSTLYKRWRNVWLLGVEWKALADMPHTRATEVKNGYFTSLNLMINKETYGANIGKANFVSSCYAS